MPHDKRLIFEKVSLQLSVDPSITLHGLARSLGVDRHIVERAVRDARGIPFRDFRKVARLKRSIVLLKSRILYIKEIAIKVGYRSPAAFSRFIKTATGETPKSIMGRVKIQDHDEDLY